MGTPHSEHIRAVSTRDGGGGGGARAGPGWATRAFCPLAGASNCPHPQHPTTHAATPPGRRAHSSSVQQSGQGCGRLAAALLRTGRRKQLPPCRPAAHAALAPCVAATHRTQQLRPGFAGARLPPPTVADPETLASAYR
jgi:hypothetical protein